MKEPTRLYVKNMVCSRCKMVVTQELQKAGIQPLHVDLGEIELSKLPTKAQMTKLNKAFAELGFEIIDDKKSQLITKIKSIIIRLVQESQIPVNMNLSDLISKELPYGYRYLSNLFSEVEGTTIEKYYITQRIEKVKELLVYDELSLSEIADRLNYSSVAYLSGQFRKVTGLTPSYFKTLKAKKRTPIEQL